MNNESKEIPTKKLLKGFAITLAIFVVLVAITLWLI